MNTKLFNRCYIKVMANYSKQLDRLEEEEKGLVKASEEALLDGDSEAVLIILSKALPHVLEQKKQLLTTAATQIKAKYNKIASGEEKE